MGLVLKCGACGENNEVDSFDPADPPSCSTCFSALKDPGAAPSENAIPDSFWGSSIGSETPPAAPAEAISESSHILTPDPAGTPSEVPAPEEPPPPDLRPESTQMLAPDPELIAAPLRSAAAPPGTKEHLPSEADPPRAKEGPPAKAPAPPQAAALRKEPVEVTAAAVQPRNLFGPTGPDGQPTCILIGPLGQDATGAVYKAYDRTAGRYFAVRFMPGQAGEEQSALLDREMQKLVAFPHPNLLPVQGTGRRQNRLYIATDLVEAAPLSRSPIRDVKRLCAIFKDAAEALHYAHDAGIFHGDVNPENLLLARGEDHVFLKDFQLAHLLETLARQTSAKDVPSELHNPAYLPPEQAKQSSRTPSAAGDIYGLGATLYTALAGKPPFEGPSSAKVFARVLMEEPPVLEKLRSDVPEALGAIVRHAMAKEPALRYPTARDMADALGRLLKGAALTAEARKFEPAAVEPVPVPHKPAPVEEAAREDVAEEKIKPIAWAIPKAPRKLPRWAIPAGAGALVLILLIAGYLIFTGPGDQGATPAAATGQVEFDVHPAPSEILVGGRKIAPGQNSVPIRAGRHRLEILFGDAHRAERDLEVIAGEVHKVELLAHRPIAAKHEERGRWADAERLYQEALAREPGDQETRELQERIARAARKRLEAESSLKVESDPPGAAVSVDGKPSGRTPLELSRLPSGLRVLEFQHEGYVPETRRVEYEPGRTPAVRVELRPRTGKVRVQGLQAGDRVRLAARTAEAPSNGIVELDAVKTGDHEIVVDRAGHGTARSNVRVEADRTAEVTGLVFKVTPGSLVVESDPAGAEVQLDGRAAGKTPLRLADVAPGPRKVRLVHPDRSDWEGEVRVAAGEKADVKATMAPLARLAVAAHPAGANLTGALTGTTRAEGRLKAGEHRVRVSHPEAGEVERTFRLAAGDEVAADVDLWALRGEELEQAGKLEEAGRAYARARNETRDQALPRLAAVWIARADEALKVRDWNKARNAAAQGLRLAPADARAREVSVAVAYAEGIAQAEEGAARSDWTHAREAAARALAARPGDARALELSKASTYQEAWTRGLAMQKDGRWAEAKRAFEQALAAKPGDADAVAALGQLKSLAWSELRFFPGYAFAVAFDPAGKTVAAGRLDKTVQLWNLETGKPLRTLSGHAGPVSSVAFSPDGRWIASGAADNSVKVWDASTGAESETLRGHTGQIWAVAFSPDGRKIASASDDRTIRLWDSETGKELRTLSGHAGTVSSVAFSADGRWIASAGGDKTIKLWDAQRGEERRTLAGHDGVVSQVVFAPGGARLASAGGDRTVRIWDLESGRELRTLSGHSSHVAQAAFTPDGRMLVSVGGDKTIRLWDVETGRELRVVSGHTGEVWSIAVVADGSRMASASSDGVRLWGLSK